MTCTIVRAPQPDTLRTRLRRARITAVFSNDERTELEKALGANKSARPSIPPRGKGPLRVSPAARRALHYSQLQSYGDHPKLPMLIIQGVGFGILLMGGLWSLLTLLDGWVR